MSTLQRRDLDRRLGAVDERRKDYFLRILDRVEHDRRFDFRLNQAYVILEGCVLHGNTEMPEVTLVERLSQHLKDKGTHISRLMFSRDFVLTRDRVVKEIANEFLAVIAIELLEAAKLGDIKTEEVRVYRFGSSQDDSAVFPYKEE